MYKVCVVKYLMIFYASPRIFFSGSAAQRGLWPPRPRDIRDHTQRRATVGRIPLDE
jgi:hypothetical protein